MTWYLIKLAALLPLLAGMIWGSLWLTRRLNSRLANPQRERAAKLVESTMLAPGMRLAVVEFRGREILVGASRHGLVRLAEARVPENMSGASETGASKTGESETGDG